MRSMFGRPIELLCIDLDDTLLDTESGAVARFRDAVTAIRSLRPDIAPNVLDAAVRRGLLTHPTEGRLDVFFERLGLTEAEIPVVRSAYLAQMVDGIRLPIGAWETLAELRQHFRLAIVTNGSSDQQRRKIARFDLESRVDWIVISEEVGFEKPDRAIFDHALRLAGIEAGRSAHVGDSLLTDVAGANDAGLHSIWLRSPLATAREDDARFTPAVTIAHLRELLDDRP